VKREADKLKNRGENRSLEQEEEKENWKRK